MVECRVKYNNPPSLHSALKIVNVSNISINDVHFL